MRQLLFAIGAICVLAIGGCDTTGGKKESYYDEPFKNADNPHTTAFKYIRNFSGQKAAMGQSGGVQTVRYYQGGKYVGRTQFSVRSRFRLQTEEDVKNRVLRILKQRFPNDNTPSLALSTYRNFQDYGVYTEKNGCVFMSFYKRLKGFGIESDYGIPDFLGLFAVCGGLTVTPEKFIQSIDQAKASDSASFIKATR